MRKLLLIRLLPIKPLLPKRRMMKTTLRNLSLTDSQDYSIMMMEPDNSRVQLKERQQALSEELTIGSPKRARLLLMANPSLRSNLQVSIITNTTKRSLPQLKSQVPIMMETKSQKLTTITINQLRNQQLRSIITIMKKNPRR